MRINIKDMVSVATDHIANFDLESHDICCAKYTDSVWEADYEVFTQELGMICEYIDYGAFTSRVRKVWVYSWVCTDTRVGVCVYFMDKTPIAWSYQPARRSNAVLEFLSEESRKMIKDFLIELVAKIDPIIHKTEVFDVDYYVNNSAMDNYGFQLPNLTVFE